MQMSQNRLDDGRVIKTHIVYFAFIVKRYPLSHSALGFYFLLFYSGMRVLVGTN